MAVGLGHVFSPINSAHICLICSAENTRGVLRVFGNTERKRGVEAQQRQGDGSPIATILLGQHEQTSFYVHEVMVKITSISFLPGPEGHFLKRHHHHHLGLQRGTSGVEGALKYTLTCPGE